MFDNVDTGVPVIETPRLRLRNFKNKDTSNYYEYHIIPEVIQHYDWIPADIKEAENDIQDIIECYKGKERLHWAITLKEDDVIIGDVGVLINGIKGEINYTLSSKYWGKGIMTEALAAILKICFEALGLVRVQALVIPENENSNKLLTRFGFVREGVLRKFGYIANKDIAIDLVSWSLLKEEFDSAFDK